MIFANKIINNKRITLIELEIMDLWIQSHNFFNFIKN